MAPVKLDFLQTIVNVGWPTDGAYVLFQFNAADILGTGHNHSVAFNLLGNGTMAFSRNENIEAFGTRFYEGVFLFKVPKLPKNQPAFRFTLKGASDVSSPVAADTPVYIWITGYQGIFDPAVGLYTSQVPFATVTLTPAYTNPFLWLNYTGPQYGPTVIMPQTGLMPAGSDRRILFPFDLQWWVFPVKNMLVYPGDEDFPIRPTKTGKSPSGNWYDADLWNAGNNGLGSDPSARKWVDNTYNFTLIKNRYLKSDKTSQHKLLMSYPAASGTPTTPIPAMAYAVTEYREKNDGRPVTPAPFPQWFNIQGAPPLI